MATELISGNLNKRRYVGVELKLLDAVTATGAGSANDLNFEGSEWAWHIKVTGSPTAVSVKLQGSRDNSTWDDIDTSTTTTEEILHVTEKPYRYVRGNLVTLTAGTAPTVSVEVVAKMEHGL